MLLFFTLHTFGRKIFDFENRNKMNIRQAQTPFSCWSRPRNQNLLEKSHNLIFRFTCMCCVRLSLTAYKLDSGLWNNVVTSKAIPNFYCRKCSERERFKLHLNAKIYSHFYFSKNRKVKQYEAAYNPV